MTIEIADALLVTVVMTVNFVVGGIAFAKRQYGWALLMGAVVLAGSVFLSWVTIA